MSLKKKTIRAISVILLGYGSQQVIRFGGNLITTRLLAPELFGAMLIANSIFALVMLLSDLGLTLSVIRHPKEDDTLFYKTVFSLKVIQGVLLFFIISLLSGGIYLANSFGLFPVESALAHPDLPIAVLITSLAALTNGFQSIQLDIQKRYQNFGRITSLTVAAQAIALSFIILTALQEPSIYSLAFANVVSAAVVCFGSYFLFDNRHNGFAWDKPSVKSIFGFGKWITASSGVVGITNSIDKFLFGYFLTGTQMGLYAIASLINAAMDTVFKKMNSSLFPALSTVLREDRKRVPEVYYKIRLYRDVITCFPACLLITNGDFLIQSLYDERYHDAGIYLQLMGIVQLVEAFLFKNQVITANGNSRIQFQTAVWRLFGMMLLIPIGFHYFGIVGALLSLALRKIFGSWLLFIEFHRLGFLRVGKELRTLAIIGVALLLGYCVRLSISTLFL